MLCSAAGGNASHGPNRAQRAFRILSLLPKSENVHFLDQFLRLVLSTQNQKEAHS